MLLFWIIRDNGKPIWEARADMSTVTGKGDFFNFYCTQPPPGPKRFWEQRAFFHKLNKGLILIKSKVFFPYFRYSTFREKGTFNVHFSTIHYQSQCTTHSTGVVWGTVFRKHMVVGRGERGGQVSPIKVVLLIYWILIYWGYLDDPSF